MDESRTSPTHVPQTFLQDLKDRRSKIVQNMEAQHFYAERAIGRQNTTATSNSQDVANTSQTPLSQRPRNGAPRRSPTHARSSKARAAVRSPVGTQKGIVSSSSWILEQCEETNPNTNLTLANDNGTYHKRVNIKGHPDQEFPSAAVLTRMKTSKNRQGTKFALHSERPPTNGSIKGYLPSDFVTAKSHTSVADSEAIPAFDLSRELRGAERNREHSKVRGYITSISRKASPLSCFRSQYREASLDEIPLNDPAQENNDDLTDTEYAGASNLVDMEVISSLENTHHRVEKRASLTSLRELMLRSTKLYDRLTNNNNISQPSIPLLPMFENPRDDPGYSRTNRADEANMPITKTRAGSIGTLANSGIYAFHWPRRPMVMAHSRRYDEEGNLKENFGASRRTYHGFFAIELVSVALLLLIVLFIALGLTVFQHHKSSTGHVSRVGLVPSLSGYDFSSVDDISVQ